MYKSYAATIVAALSHSVNSLQITSGTDILSTLQGDDWQLQTKEVKFNEVWSRISADLTGVQDYHFDKMHQLFEQKSNISTCKTGDEMPRAQDETGEARHKLVHTKGVVGQIEFEAFDDYNLDDYFQTPTGDNVQYSGLYGSGATLGVIRMSETGFLLGDIESTHMFAPSVAIKFFVDDHKAANLLFQVSFDGISDPWFFAENFTNHPPRSTNQCHQNTVDKKFAEATAFLWSNGTGQLASVLEDGTELDDADVVLPYEVVLVPNREAFPEDSSADFLSYLTNADYQPADGEKIKLFDVRASYNPEDPADDTDRVLIGQINLTTPLTRSTWGDESLFFQHEIFSRDTRKLNSQGTEGRLRKQLWLADVLDHETHHDGVTWGDTEVIDITTLALTPQETIEDGLTDTDPAYACPFKWLLQ